MEKNNKSQITTIKIDKKTKERLDHLREHEKETYNEVINKIINVLNICITKPLLAGRILRDIERSKKRGKLIENPEKLLKKKINPNNKSEIIVR